MTYFAELDNTLTVVQVTTGTSEDDGKELELCASTGRTFRQTYKGGKRKNFGNKGFTYDKDRDAFIPPRPYTSWTLNETTCLWEPPTTYPSGDKEYVWDESSKSWKESS